MNFLPKSPSVRIALLYAVIGGVWISYSDWAVEKLVADPHLLTTVQTYKGWAFVVVTAVGLGLMVERDFHVRQESEKRYRSLFDNMLDGYAYHQMIFKDGQPQDYLYLDVNGAFERLTGLKNVVGKTINEVIPNLKDEHPELLEIYGRVAVSGRPERFELYVQPLAAWFNISVYSPEKGYFVVVFDNITERKRNEAALRELSGRLLHAQDDERRHIAKELHDSTTQDLTAVAMNVGMLADQLRGSDPKVDKLASDSLAIVEKCTRDIRTLSRLLHPPLLDEVGLAAALRHYTEGFGMRSGIKVTVDVADGDRLSAELETTLFRVVQEALGNIHRHSGSTAAVVRLVREGGEVVLEIQDRGHGFPSELLVTANTTMAGLGVGILGMRERLRQLGGQLEILSNDQGTTVRAVAPVTENV